MTLDEIRESTKDMLTPADIADVLGCEVSRNAAAMSGDAKYRGGKANG